MYFKSILVAAAMFIGGNAIATAQSETGLDSPMKQAVMNSYEQMLKENPKDYQVYFRRANEYYNHNKYSKALADINEALNYAPAKEKDVRFQCFSLRASIYERMGMYQDAISDLNSALAIDPSSYATLYQKANTLYEMGDYQAAKNDYLKLQRLNSRSQEALFGLARVSVKENNMAQANKYLDDAVGLTPTQSDVYMKRASVRSMMGNNQGAVDDYITALTVSKGSSISKPLQELVDMSYTDYNAVIGGLSNAISKSPRQGMFYYIRGAIAQAHFNYTSAVTDFEYIIKNYLYDYPGIYRSLAECLYALGKYPEALENIDTAIGSTADNADAYIVKSDIKRAMKSYRNAVEVAKRALAKSPDNADAYVAEALALLDSKFVPEGSVAMGKALIASPNDPYVNMLRAWVLTDYLNQEANAAEIYENVIKLNTYPVDNAKSLKGFAMMYTGKTEEGDAWMENVLKAAENINDGEAEYYGACYYGARGNFDRAFDCMEKSLKKGYANYHNWTDNNTARINVAPLRDEARFNILMTRYSFIFKTAEN